MPTTVFQNPSASAGFLANLFGLGGRYGAGGGFRIRPKETAAGNFPFANPLFTEGASGSISDYLNLTGDNAFTSSLGRIGQTGNFDFLPDELRDPYNQATSTFDRLIASGTPLLEGLMATGLPVDVSGTVQNRYAKTILPTTAEMYNPAQGTAFQNVAAREAANLIAELEYPAQEAARARQVQGLTVGAPSLAGLATARTALPGAMIAELQKLSGFTDPGGRLLEALLSMLGYATQPTVGISRGDSPSGLAEVVGSLATVLPGINSAIRPPNPPLSS